MIGGFFDDKYILTTPKTPRHWTDRLFNDEYVVELNQVMQGGSVTFNNYNTKEFIKKQRHFYIKDMECNSVFCPLYAPLKSKLDCFKSIYGLAEHIVQSEAMGIETEIRAFVPVKGQKEIWTIRLKNKTKRKRVLSVFSVYSLEDFSFMGSNAVFDKDLNCIIKHSVPGSATYDETCKAFNELQYVYAYCDSEVKSFETNKYRFYGCEDETEMPLAVERGECSDTITQGMESIVAGFENRIVLDIGESVEINFVLGVTDNDKKIKNETDIDIADEYAKVTALWKNRYEGFVPVTGYEELDLLTRYWFKKQVTFLSRTNRLDCSSPVRNELQDAMGYAFCEPYEAFEIVKKVLKRQKTNGYIKQWNIHDGTADRGLSKLRHSDAPLWVAICCIEIISHIIKDKSLYDVLVEYGDSEKKESIKEHIEKALYFMSNKNEQGAHGLCLIRDGDWTDPMNAPGRKGQGESVWNSMALVYAINEYSKIFDDEELKCRAEKLDVNINKYAWDGEWYLAALDDDGRKVGTHEDEEGKIFLNTQTWAIISGVARNDRADAVRKSIQTLKTDFGCKLSDPPFSKWNEKWGKISIKQMGALENGSVYCHGTLFNAFADYLTGDFNSAIQGILSTLPTNPKNLNDKNLQLPLYVPNYYFGIENENYGHSSCFYNTGTTSWIMVILNRMIEDGII